jgi:20S proteasome alpha/beta subunit
MLDRVNVPMKLKHGLIYDHPMNTSLIRNSTVTHTQTPIVTGTSVLGVRYRDGIMLAADTLASYGSLARFFDVQRLYPVGSYTIVGASGDLSDFQYLQSLLDELMIDDYITQDQHSYSPEHIYQYLGRVMYQRRSKFDPLWNALVGYDVRSTISCYGIWSLFGPAFVEKSGGEWGRGYIDSGSCKGLIGDLHENIILS